MLYYDTLSRRYCNVFQKNEHTLEMHLLKIKTWTASATQRNLVQDTKTNKNYFGADYVAQ